ncbi:MAG: hypothetical protein ACUVTP_12910 [Candidatus Fervidibacter sp.]|uniref:hypothetical protein n=1 Tax=Candidatus Fervidibacter sp. TaxID=3100871 RepID=UPI00404B5D09
MWRIGQLLSSWVRIPASSPPIQVEVRRLNDGQLVAKLPRFGFTISPFPPMGATLSPFGINLSTLMAVGSLYGNGKAKSERMQRA